MSFSEIKDGLHRGKNEHGLMIDITYGPVIAETDMQFQEVWAIYVALSDNERGSVFIAHTETLEQAMDLAETLTDDDIPFGWSRADDVVNMDSETTTETIYRMANQLRTKSHENSKMLVDGSYYLGYQRALDDMMLSSEKEQ